MTAPPTRTRLACSEILTDEQAVTAAGFWQRAHTWFAPHASPLNEPSPTTAPATGHGPETTPALPPQTNGKVESLHRIQPEAWAHIRPWRNDQQRTQAHGALGWSTPTDTP